MNELMKFLEERKQFRNSLFIVLVAANIFIWQAAWAERQSEEFALYFLNVGQGDSQLVNLPGDVQVLIDGGKGAHVLNELGKILVPTDRYIDIVVATHPDLDHFGGLVDVLKNYEVGAIVTNGRIGEAGAFTEFQKEITEKEIPELHLFAGDTITHGDTTFSVLSPTAKNVQKENSNNSSYVLLLEHGGLRALYTADVDTLKENELIRKHDLNAQILKVGHHGSKYSSGNAFLNEVQPKLAFISVGKNSYGHPTKEAVGRLANIGAQTFTTQQEGTMKVMIRDNKIQAMKLD